MTTAVPPLIPGSLNLSTLEVGKAKIDQLLGDALSTLNTWKGAVRVATTANITLSGTQTIDTIVLVVGNKVLVKNQATGSENGLYIVDDAAWSRSDDLITGSNAAGVAVFVSEGAVSVDTVYVCTNDEATAVVGTDALVFATLSSTVAAAGSDTQVQYNSGGSFAGDAAFTFVVGSGTLTSTILSDGTASLTAGALSGVTDITSTGNTILGSAITDTLGFYGVGPVTQPAVSTANTAFVANTSGITDGTATYNGWSVEGLITQLQSLGIIA